ncbi:pneumococcal serine-rich repeat protein isoform X3 [Magallana gigas]
MTVQSSVASMDATVPCTRTAEETSGMMCSATVSTETSSSICGATLSKEMSPTIWATPEIDSTERTCSPAIPVESTLCEITFGSSAERSSDTFIPSGDSTSLVSEESMTVQSSVASMDATVPCTRTAEETSGMMCSATVSTETSSSICGATLSKEMSPTIWATPEIDSTERTCSPAIPVESTLCEITFGSSAERSSDTFIPSGDSTSLVSEESMTVQSSVASMDATVPCTSTAEETSGMMCSATVSTETSSSIRGATLSKEMSPTIWATPEIDSTETRSNSTIPFKSTSCEITFGSSEELSSDTFIPSGDSTSLVSEESMTVQSSVASMDATVPCTSTAEETSGMMCSATVSTETSSSIRGATLSKEMSPTIWATPEIDSTETRSSPAIPVESTLCEITFGSSAGRSSDTFIPSGDSTSLVSEESMTVQSSVASMDATVPCTSTAEETSGMMCSATVSTETSSSIRGATLSKEMSPTIWATPEIDSTERTSSPAIPVESTLCEITFGSSAERSSDTFIPSGDSTSLVSEESMTVQSSVASMKKMGVMSKDATVPHSSTVQKTPGMISSATVSMSVDEANMALRSHLTDFEKMLLKTQDLVEIRGKTGRGVPVLIPKETNKVLEYLSDPVARQMASIRPENKYMFANTGRTVVRAGESLDLVKFRSEVALRFPERIYANNLRKHTATIAQALNLNDTEMKYICNHLGHTQKVHDLVYRQTSGMIERLDIAKLMLIQEFNVVGKYQNKKLSEIQFDELGTLERKIQDQDQEQQDTENAADQGKNVDDDIDIEDDFTVCRKKAKKSERVRWSPAEEEEIKKYFSRYFEGHFQKKCPSREHCLDALKKSKENGGTIFKRKWETLKKKVSNMLVKIQV